jgi:hypothetical protein
MKTIKNITAFILALGLIGIGFAQTSTTPTTTGGPVTSPTITMPPEELHIGSQAELRSWACSQICGGNIQIYGETVMWDSQSQTYFDLQGTLADNVVQKLAASSLYVRVSDREKPLGTFATLYNKERMTLFYGYEPATVSDQGKIVWEKNIDVNELAYDVPIFVGENITSAYIRTDNSWDTVYVNDGWIFFPNQYAGADGELVLWDGSREIWYSLSSGTLIPGYLASGSVGVTLADYQSFSDEGYSTTNPLYVGVQGYVGDNHKAPVASVKVTSTRVVKFACSITDVTVKGGMNIPVLSSWLFSNGGKDKMPISLLPGQWVTLTLSPGEYTFGPNTEIYNQPPPINVGGEKG